MRRDLRSFNGRAPIRLLMIAWAAGLWTHRLSAQENAAPATLPGVEVKEWLIIVSAPNQAHANSASAVVGSLPEGLDPLRLIAPGERSGEPCPVGVIRVAGHTDTKFSIRLITPDDGVVYTTWPLAHVRSPNLVWPDLTLSATPRRLKPAGDLQWLAPLRDSPAPYLTTAGRSEKFLLYDAEFPFFLPLTLEAGKGNPEPIRVRNRGDSTLHDVVLYRPPRDGKGWSNAQVPDVPPKRESGPFATAPVVPAEVEFTPVDGDPAKRLADDWKTRLARWELQQPDVDLIVTTLRAYALDERQTTAVFTLDESEMERLLPMRIAPSPARVRRLGIVVARNIDPALPAIIDALVLQLGDPDWHKREAAGKALARFGQSANNRLREALHSADTEIATRAERLLARNASR
jgi:hypothetical protein